MIKMKTSGVTSALNVRYLKPIFISKGKITVTGKVVSVDEKLATITASLTDGEGTECATAEIVYFCFPENTTIPELRRSTIILLDTGSSIQVQSGLGVETPILDT